MTRNILFILLIGTALLSITPCRSDTAQVAFYSDKSLQILCGPDGQPAMCKAYIHGVVETWMIKDTVSFSPKDGAKYTNRGESPFCEKILNHAEDEWVAIVKGNLSNLRSGFATMEVMNILHKNYCGRE